MEIAVLGGGYAGISVMQQLEDMAVPDLSIELVDESGKHELQHTVHRVIRNPGLAADYSLPIEEIVPNANVHTARVTDIDPNTPAVSLNDGTLLDPDALVVAIGATTADYGIPGVLTHGYPCKSIEAANDIRSQLEHHVDRNGRVVVGGAGLSGIQIAGELNCLQEEFELNAEVMLLEQQETVAPRFPTAFGQAVTDVLGQVDITVNTETRIESVSQHSIEIASGEPIDYDLFVWTGGIRGQDVMGSDRWKVDADLRVADRTFGAGDAVAATDVYGDIVPAAAQTAIKQGEVAATNAVEVLASSQRDTRPELTEYSFRSPGWFVSIGDKAVGILHNRVIKGKGAKLAKHGVTARYMASVAGIHPALKQLKGGLMDVL